MGDRASAKGESATTRGGYRGGYYRHGYYGGYRRGWGGYYGGYPSYGGGYYYPYGSYYYPNYGYPSKALGSGRPCFDAKRGPIPENAPTVDEQAGRIFSPQEMRLLVIF